LLDDALFPQEFGISYNLNIEPSKKQEKISFFSKPSLFVNIGIHELKIGVQKGAIIRLPNVTSSD